MIRRPLGNTQRAMIGALLRHGPWYPGCGWIWENPSTTRRVLDTLVRRGHVEKQGNRYELTPLGRFYFTNYLEGA